MITLIHSAATGMTYRGFTGGENPTVSAISDPIVAVAGSVAPAVVDDANISRETAATTHSRYQIAANFPLDGVASYASSDEGVATVSAAGVASYVSAGTATITATAARRGKVAVALEFAETPGAQVDSLSTWVAGTLAAHCAAAIDGRISGLGEAAKAIFSTQNHATGSYTRSAACWAADIAGKLTCLSPWNSREGQRRAGTLVTPRHMIGAAHYLLNAGDAVRFVGTGGTVYNRTIAARAIHPNYVPYAPDFCLYALDSDLPAEIEPCQIAPSALLDHLPNIAFGIPCLALDGEEKALVKDLYSLASGQARFAVPSDAARLAFHEYVIAGDSGNPIFLIADGELVLLSVWTSSLGGTFSGAHIAAFNTMIGTADTAAGDATGYAVEVADLSGFPTY